MAETGTEKFVLERYLTEYISSTDNENANRYRSVQHFVTYLRGKLLEPIVYDFLEKISPVAVRLHRECLIHLNKMFNDLGMLVPYCCGYDLATLFREGLRTCTCYSRPPKHFDAAVDQAVNFCALMALERSGAIGLNAIELYLAPYVRHDRLSYQQVKQGIQRFIYNLSFPGRQGYETWFINVIFQIGNDFYWKMPAYVAGRTVGTLGDYIDEAMLIFRAFLEVYLEGDAYGRPFAFPIPSVLYTKTFEKLLAEYELEDLFWRCVAERGYPYFLNSYNGERNTVVSFCCRLNVDLSKFINPVSPYATARGVWTFPSGFGSYAFVTLNLAGIYMRACRIYGGKEEKHFYDMLMNVLYVVRKFLRELRTWYDKLHRMGMYPMTKIYNPEFPRTYYGTFGLACIAELTALIMNEPNLWLREISPDGQEYVRDIVRVQKNVLEFVSRLVREFEEEDHVPYNIEEVPGESSTYRFAMHDWQEYPEFRQFIPHAPDPVTGMEVSCYTTQLTPEYTTYRLDTQLYIEGQNQKLFTGGVMKHIYAHRPVEPEGVRRIIESALREYGLVYVSYTPTQSICLDCGYRTTALIWECPKCGSKNIEQWSRIVGYYRPIRNWNKGRRALFTRRFSI